MERLSGAGEEKGAPLLPFDTSEELSSVLEYRPFSVATLRPAGFEKTAGGGPNPGDLLFPPMASYRCTISDIEVRRPLARGFGSSGDGPPRDSIEERSAAGRAELSLLDFEEGKTNMD
jgi:hypothetical protein